MSSNEGKPAAAEFFKDWGDKKIKVNEETSGYNIMKMEKNEKIGEKYFEKYKITKNNEYVFLFKLESPFWIFLGSDDMDVLFTLTDNMFKITNKTGGGKLCIKHPKDENYLSDSCWPIMDPLNQKALDEYYDLKYYFLQRKDKTNILEENKRRKKEEENKRLTLLEKSKRLLGVITKVNKVTGKEIDRVNKNNFKMELKF